MSNGRRLKTGPAKERCSFCRRAPGRDPLRLRTGQLACGRCQESGGLQRLDCGHYGMAGALRVSQDGGRSFMCAACAREAA